MKVCLSEMYLSFMYISCHYYCVIVRIFLKTFNINQLQEACVVTLYIHYIITTVLYLYYPLFNL